MRLSLAPVLAALALAGCPADGDDAPAVDAAPDGTPRPDAEDLCRGALTVEGGVFDLDGDAALVGATLTEIGEPSHQATSAPNGRVVLCATEGATADVRLELGDGAARTERVAAAAVGRLRAGGDALPLGIWSAAQLAIVAIDLGTTVPDAASTWLLVHVVAADGAPRTGATVTIGTPHGTVFTRQADGSFLEGDVIAAGGVVLATDVATDDLPDVEVELPDGADDACVGPGAAVGAADAIAGLTFACE
jgi:hypothetical protein